MKKGDQFTVVRGPFEGFNAVVIEDMSYGYRCDVDVFGHPIVTVIENDCLPGSCPDFERLLDRLNLNDLKELQKFIGNKLMNN